MNNRIPQITVRLSERLRTQIDSEAAARGWSPSELIRRAIDHYFNRDIRSHQADLRHHRISEFSQIALDQIIRREHPDLVEVIVAETNKRMERHHGAR